MKSLLPSLPKLVKMPKVASIGKLPSPARGFRGALGRTVGRFGAFRRGAR